MLPFDKFQNDLTNTHSSTSFASTVSLKEVLDKILSISEMGSLIENSVVLIRADLDVPLSPEGLVLDDSRLISLLPTIKFCMDNKAKIVLMGHIGRDPKESLMPVCKYLNEKLGFNITFISNWINEEKLTLDDTAVNQIKEADQGHIFMFENTRKYEVERSMWKATDENIHEKAAYFFPLVADIRNRLADIEINECLAASNFDFSSSVLPLGMRYTGLGMYIRDELVNHFMNMQSANMIVMSGLKVDKLDSLEEIIKFGNTKLLIVAGSLAMALKKAKAQLDGSDFCIGRAESEPTLKSYIDITRINQAKRIVNMCREQMVELIMPVDFVLDNGEISDNIPPDRLQFDIGPKTTDLIKSVLHNYMNLSLETKGNYTLYINGVFGKFEDEQYSYGTKHFMSLLPAATEAGIKTYVGGGEGRLALEKYCKIKDVTHAFTAGGTILKLLSGNQIFYLKAMYIQNINSIT